MLPKVAWEDVRLRSFMFSSFHVLSRGNIDLSTLEAYFRNGFCFIEDCATEDDQSPVRYDGHIGHI